jgi:hypothetical protein
MCGDSTASRVGPVNLELNRLSGLLLHHLGARGHVLAIRNIADAKLHEVARWGGLQAHGFAVCWSRWRCRPSTVNCPGALEKPPPPPSSALPGAHNRSGPRTGGSNYRDHVQS